MMFRDLFKAYVCISLCRPAWQIQGCECVEFFCQQKKRETVEIRCVHKLH